MCRIHCVVKKNFVGCRLMPPTPHGFLGRRRACHGGLSWAGLGASEGPKSTPRGQKGSPEGSGSLLGARSAPGGHQGCSETASGRLLGRSWGALGVVLGPLGSLPAPPGPLLGVIVASRGCLVRGFYMLFWRLGPGPWKKKRWFRCFCGVFCVLFWFSF